jgi:proteasome lid subunit RPN8/RPN11
MPSRLKPLYITRKCWKLVLIYSISGRECLFLFGGKDRTIVHVERIRNIARNGRTTAKWISEDYEYAWKKIRQLGLSPIAEGHSHVDEKSDQHPSSVDVHVIPTGNIELICFPLSRNIRAWKIADTLRVTLKNEIELIQI